MYCRFEVYEGSSTNTHIRGHVEVVGRGPRFRGIDKVRCLKILTFQWNLLLNTVVFQFKASIFLSRIVLLRYSLI